MSVLQYILSLQGPRGEQHGKALSGADFVCVVANPSTPNYIYIPTPFPSL